MTSILSNINIGGGGSSFGGIGSMLTTSSGSAISLTDYKIFAVASICISSIFAAILISIIKKGNAQEAFKSIPLYLAFGIANYFIAFTVLNYMLGGFFN
jgi:hypothetical protein